MKTLKICGSFFCGLKKFFLKIARNIATHEGPTREMFGKWMPQIIENFIKNVN
jgi:hypothetical protein